MSQSATPPASRTDLGQARRWLIESGEVPQGLVDEALSRSWERSRHAGLSPVDAMLALPQCAEGELRQALSAEHDFLAQARPVMDFVFGQMLDSGSLVALSDARGLLLHSLGDADFLSRADRVSLRPGALWHEVDRGTNAIGTALAERRPVVIHGAEHYLERHSFLTCAAAPVFGPAGQLRGVLDISGDHRSRHPHTFALVRSAARMIEDRLFHARHTHERIVRLHTLLEGLGGVGEGLLALSEDGWVVGANTLAQQWLLLEPTRIGACTLEQLTGAGLGLWPPGKVMRLARGERPALYARLDAPRTTAVSGIAPASQSTSAATSTATSTATSAPTAAAGNAATSAPGHPAQAPVAEPPSDAALDPRVRDAQQRARRVQAQGIAVLIQGESGSGKEVLARHLHDEGSRAHKPFVAVNCAALPEGLIEAELFGYVGGAFTGARREGSPGRIRDADGGTLFLDEIGDMPLGLQARLLRVLQERVVVPVGGSKPVPVDFQLVSATHRQLKDAIAAGQFREDLYWRLNGLTVTLPPLRERQDFHTVVDLMLRSIAGDMGLPRPPEVLPGLRQALAAHRWPGNLRQLHGVLRTACALLEADAHSLDWRHLPEDMAEALHEPNAAATQAQAPAAGDTTPPRIPEANLRRLSSQAIRQVVADTGGNMSEAARRLGISRNTLYRRLKDLGSGADR
ncbi:MAG: sigma-54-dependent Fis family transcriptional regulator [Proteobacteria bacterium]|uniref:sigma-54-dependent Fis family transcriptional regulator n=1 Tax=Aquabacterium sp. TaxID=1872578 RepID=UPI0035C68944|nr:sigma-54-dependent Fis family transcriptional regulator [Pseudomonadota bacterium]